MLYTINLDSNSYVLSLGHTKNDNVDLDLSNVEIKYINAYQYINGSLILDSAKKDLIILEEQNREKLARIEELKIYLNSTDYIMARMLEEIMALNNPLTFIADIIKIFVAYGTKYTAELEARKQARKEIEELEK